MKLKWLKYRIKSLPSGCTPTFYCQFTQQWVAPFLLTPPCAILAPRDRGVWEKWRRDTNKRKPKSRSALPTYEPQCKNEKPQAMEKKKQTNKTHLNCFLWNVVAQVKKQDFIFGNTTHERLCKMQIGSYLQFDSKIMSNNGWVWKEHSFFYTSDQLSPENSNDHHRYWQLIHEGESIFFRLAVCVSEAN